MKRLLGAVVLVTVSNAPAADTIFLTRRQALDWALPGAVRVEERHLTLSPEERAALHATHRVQLPETLTYYAGHGESSVIGYALFVDEIGKHRPITFVVAMSPSGAVRDIEVTVYREAIGDGVRQRRFLDQFRGKRAGDPLRVGRDLDGISGATLSCWAAERAVRMALALGGVIASSNGGTPSP